MHTHIHKHIYTCAVSRVSFKALQQFSCVSMVQITICGQSSYVCNCTVDFIYITVADTTFKQIVEACYRVE